MHILGFQLHTHTPKQALAFYTHILGMQLRDTHSSPNHTIYTLGFGNSTRYIQLTHPLNTPPSTYQHHPQDNYWKFSLFVEDIQRSYQKIVAHQHPISEPFQLGDIGYLAHTADSEQHHIELIQKTFKNHPLLQAAPETSDPLGELPVLGLLTIRTTDPIQAIRFYETVLDMQLLVRMQVNRGNGFSLYFLGSKQHTPPNPDIDAIENRHWLYQQNDLFIEIQHYWGNQGDANYQLNPSNNGLAQTHFAGDLDALQTRLQALRIAYTTQTHPHNQQQTMCFHAPDGHVLVVEAS